MRLREETTLSGIEMAAILISTVIGVAILPFPLFAVRGAGTGAGMLTLMAIGITLIGLLSVIALGLRFPGQSIIQYGAQIIGRPAAAMLNALLIVFYIVLTASAAREFGTVVVTSVLKQTPIEATVIIMLLIAAISARKDLRTFANIHLFYTPIILMPVLLIVCLSFQNAEPLYLLPIFDHTPQILSSLLTITAMFQGFFIITLLIPHMRQQSKAWVSGLSGLGVAGALYLLIITSTVAVFGAEEVKELLYPTLELAKATNLPANIMERLDAAFISVWVTAVFTTLFSNYYFAVHALKQWLGTRDHRLFVFFLLPFLMLIAMLPENVLQMYEGIALIARGGFVLTVLCPVLLLAIAVIRGKRGAADAH